MTLVLLPGLDGTEVFFAPLLRALPARVRPLVISYPHSREHGYAELLALIRERIADVGECFVLGWSFSGPLALMLAAAEPQKVRGVILSATFVRVPNPVLRRVRHVLCGPTVLGWRVARRLPLWLFRPRGDPMRRAKNETLRRISSAVLAVRLREVLRVDARRTLCACPQPVLYLESSDDAIVPGHNVAEIRALRPSVEVVTITGPHQAMYTNPDAAAAAIARFVAVSPEAAGASAGPA